MGRVCFVWSCCHRTDKQEDEKKGESTVSGKQNSEFKGIDVLRKSTTQLKSGLYVLSPKKHFPLCRI